MAQIDNPKQLISLTEATKFCNYSQEYLSLRARTKKLKSVKVGRNWMTTKSWLDEYVNKIEDYNQTIKKASKESPVLANIIADNPEPETPPAPEVVIKTVATAPKKAIVPPPENLPTGDSWQHIFDFSGTDNVRFGVVYALTAFVLVCTIFAGQPTIKTVHNDIADFSDLFQAGAGQIASSMPNSTNQSVFSVSTALDASASNTIDNIIMLAEAAKLPFIDSASNVSADISGAKSNLSGFYSPFLSDVSEIVKYNWDVFKEYCNWISNGVGNLLGKK